MGRISLKRMGTRKSERALEAWLRRHLAPTFVPPVEDEDIEFHLELGARVQCWESAHLQQVKEETDRQARVLESAREAEQKAEREKACMLLCPFGLFWLVA